MSRYANADFSFGTMSRALRGIARPIQTTVPEGSRLYRFVDIGRGPARRQANSPWWLEHEPFQNLRHFAERHDHTLGDVARMFLAVLHEYSALTGYVSARVVKPLLVWRGPGSVQYSSGANARDPARLIPMQGMNEIYQLYIPGMSPDTPVLDEAFTDLQYHRLA